MARALKIAFALALAIGQVLPAFASVAEPGAERVGSPPLRWRSKVVTIALSTSLLRPQANIKSGSEVVEAVRRSLHTWEEASGIQFREVFSEKQNVSPQGPIGDGISLITVAPSAENALLFGRDEAETTAATRVFFDRRGRISEADIVLNPYQQFSTDGTFGTFDLQSAFTHEIGHALGLDHVLMPGATMYENTGKNGLFGLPDISRRTLSDADRSAVRAKYGTSGGDNCCGTVLGKVFLPDGKPAADLAVWLEDAVTGRVISEAVTGGDGTLELGGIPEGTYNIFSSRKARVKKAVPMQSLGSIEVTAGESASFLSKLASGSDDIDATYAGFNGQLVLGSIPVNAGRSYTVYVGGRNLSPGSVEISFSSPFLVVRPGTVSSVDYGDNVSVISFEVDVDQKAPVGEYSIFIGSPSGGRSAVVGGISVRAFPNPFSNFILDNKLQ